MLDIKNKVREITGIGPDSIPSEVLHSTEPVILKALVASWPSVAAASAGDLSSLGYLRRFCVDQDVVVFKGSPTINGRFFYNQDLSGLNFDRTSSTLESMLTQFESLNGEAGEPSLYIGSTSLDDCFPGFRTENDIELGELKPLISIWMGNQTRIAAHFDSPNNIACVLSGQRRFTLFPPDQIANLYVGPLDFTPAGQAISLVDFHQPDYARYPLFREALQAARVAELEPGDAIFIPSMWWHHVEALSSFNVLVNYWWKSAATATGTPIDALVHTLLCVRDLPSEQKRAWRLLFDHYIFDDAGDTFAHIPDKSLGVLGDLDDATVRQLRAMLRRKLEK